MLTLFVVIVLAGAIVLFAVQIVAGWISPKLGIQVRRAIDAVGSFILKLSVVVLAGLIVYVVIAAARS